MAKLGKGHKLISGEKITTLLVGVCDVFGVLPTDDDVPILARPKRLMFLLSIRAGLGKKVDKRKRAKLEAVLDILTNHKFNIVFEFRLKCLKYGQMPRRNDQPENVWLKLNDLKQFLYRYTSTK
jgi:hypothetical protein